MTSVIRGVLFDFSGTLFHFEPDLDSQPLDRARLIDTVTSPTPAEGLPPGTGTRSHCNFRARAI